MKEIKYSIIIPTYNNCEKALIPCIESLIKYCDFKNAEVIISANGCVDGTRGYVESLMIKYPGVFKLVWSDDALGYPKAVNKGIEEVVGEYIVLLNNDTQLLEQPLNYWLTAMSEPMDKDSTIGITGPMKAHSPRAGREFLIFFCVMIRWRLFKIIGLLDEYYSPGYGEDTDFCCKAEEAGFRVIQVPTEDRLYSDDAGKRMIGQFPIWHEGNVTFRQFNEDNDLFLHCNDEILADRWNKPSVSIEKAKTIDGFMSDVELEWLAIQATKYNRIIEVGSWQGRSTRALIDNAKGTVFAVDHWLGSATEADMHHQAKWGEGDWAYFTFMKNTLDHVLNGTLIPVRLHSKNAAALFKNNEIKADLIFIDGGHTYEEVKEDIALWLPLVREGGILCGHDYYEESDGAWPGVKKAVDEMHGIKVIPNGSIWWKMVSKNDLKLKVGRVYDCFPFFNELDLLEVRLNELDAVVDRWVIVEATKSHGGNDKPLYFKDNLERFSKFIYKITHIVVEDYPQGLDSWGIERHQRDSILRGLTDCKDEDIIIIGDVDEIPKADVIREYTIDKGLCCISIQPSYYYMNCVANEPWNWLRILPYNIMKKMTPCEVRYVPNYDLENQVIALHGTGGWHYSFLGGIDKWIEKLENTAHQEFNKPEYKNPNVIEKLVAEGKDILFRDHIKYEYLDAIRGDTYPKFVNDNFDHFINIGFINTFTEPRNPLNLSPL